MLAGISSDYYLRLEQGRDQNPSAQVLDAIANVLQLDADSIAYLHELSRPKPRRKTQSRPDRVPEGTLLFLNALDMPAFVHSRFMDVLAANRFGQALSPSYRPGVNLLRAVFLDPTDRELRQDWDRATEEAVAGLRAVAGSDTDEPRLIELVGELSLHSDRFRQLWARHDVHTRSGGISLLKHPQVGELKLRHEKLAIAGTNGQLLVAYHADPGSESARSLALLGSLVASSVDAASRAPDGTAPEKD